MRWIRRPDSIAPGGGSALAALATLVALLPLTLGVQTAGAESLAFVAAYIPNGQTQYTAYTTTLDKQT